LKKSRRNFGPRKSVVDVEIWFAQKTELSWFLRSNAKIQRFLIYRKAALSEADFFNKIGRLLPVTTVCLTVVGTNQRIETTFLSRFSLIADIERLPVAACWMCSLHQAIIGRLRSM